MLLKEAAVNPERGEVSLVVRDSNDQVVESFVLVMNTNALVILEQSMGMNIDKIVAKFMNPGLGELRAGLHAALGAHHPGMSVKDAGKLIDRVGMPAAADAVRRVFESGFPVPKKGDKAQGAAGKGNGRGTGERSSPTRRKQGSVQKTSG